MEQPPLSLRRRKRVEYERLVDLGVFEREPIEFIGGQLIVAEPQNSPHATAVGAADDALRAALPPGFIVRARMPVALDDESSPEPDLAVVPGRRADFQLAHPTRAALVVEVADSSLRFDREEKGEPLCAGADRGVLDRQPDRPRPRDLSRPGARPGGAPRMAVSVGGHPGAAVRDHAGGATDRADPDRRPAALGLRREPVRRVTRAGRAG